jgi:hypothetical protein
MIASKWQAYGSGELILTDQRVCFYKAGLTGETFEAIPISKLTSVEFKSTLGIRKLTLHTSHDDMAIQLMGGKAAVDALQGELEQLRNEERSPVKPEARESAADKIRSLSELRDQGILTDEEFQAKKTELLAKM